VKTYPLEEKKQWEANMKAYQISTAQDPSKHGRPPFRIFDPGKGDPWRELHLVDADNIGVTTIGPVMDPTDMSLGNALFLMECVNSHQDLVNKVADLEEERKKLLLERDELLSRIHDLEMKLREVRSEI